MDCIDIAQFGVTPIMPFQLVAANDGGRLAVRTARRMRREPKIRPLTALD